ncbi:RNA-guided endonuclease InsQ/TnpB family protein [Saccharopolyspora shandongensis]|uniref:RNA-guided endonuclease InsQ/TnpB family protein n=1 Tax=Saccharopolyspora shandongensis TaxID=418495 RepID=UPI0033D23FB0
MRQSLVRRAYKYRFYPTQEQELHLLRTFGCVRLVYNKALEARTSAWQLERKRVNYAETSALLTLWKKQSDLAFLNEVSSVPLQQALRHLQSAFTSFFTKRSNYPRTKSRKRSRQSAEYTRSAFRWRDGKLTLAKMREPLNVVWSRPLPEGASPSTVTVSCDTAGRWFVSILVEARLEHLPLTDAVVGVDMGVESFVALSTGEKVANLRFERQERVCLARAQRELSRKERGSRNYVKACREVARVHARTKDRRRDYLHKLSTRLVRENQTIVIEDLNVQGMRHDRDVNAAKNILAAGLAVVACGGGVRPSRP